MSILLKNVDVFSNTMYIQTQNNNNSRSPIHERPMFHDDILVLGVSSFKDILRKYKNNINTLHINFITVKISPHVILTK